MHFEAVLELVPENENWEVLDIINQGRVAEAPVDMLWDCFQRFVKAQRAKDKPFPGLGELKQSWIRQRRNAGFPSASEDARRLIPSRGGSRAQMEETLRAIWKTGKLPNA